jgi:peptide/nickel transport system permease protein
VARYLLGRLLQIAVVVVLVATITFFLLHLAPGDPFGVALENPSVTEAVRAHWRESYGLDRPLPEQYVKYVANIARGDLGWSISLQRPVADELRDKLPNTIYLMALALFASFAVGIGAAVLQVMKPGSLVDRVIGGVSLFLFSLPEFWLALMMIFLAYRLPFLHLPFTGMTEATSHSSLGLLGRIGDIARHTVLPVLTLTLIFSAVVARYQRAALLDVLPAEYVKTARAKGVPERTIVRHHALRNALLPTISLFGLAFPALITGAVYVERVFSWPGMGQVILNSIGSRDYTLLTASVIVGSFVVALGSLLADLLYMVADPRLAHDR